MNDAAPVSDSQSSPTPPPPNDAPLWERIVDFVQWLPGQVGTSWLFDYNLPALFEMLAEFYATEGEGTDAVRPMAVAAWESRQNVARASQSTEPTPALTNAPPSAGEIWPDVEDYNDWLNEILANTGDEWDRDEAIEAIVVEYVRHLEAEIARGHLVANNLAEALRRLLSEATKPYDGKIEQARAALSEYQAGEK